MPYAQKFDSYLAHSAVITGFQNRGEVCRRLVFIYSLHDFIPDVCAYVYAFKNGNTHLKRIYRWFA
jgi:hypothetical protein